MLLVVQWSEEVVCVRNELISFQKDDPKKPNPTEPLLNNFARLQEPYRIGSLQVQTTI